MFDCRPAKDEAKMDYIFSTKTGKKILSDLVAHDNTITIGKLKSIFSIKKVFDERSKSFTF